MEDDPCKSKCFGCFYIFRCVVYKDARLGLKAVFFQEHLVHLRIRLGFSGKE